jgi:hypothetical protein
VNSQTIIENPIAAIEQSNGNIVVVTGFNNTEFPNLEVFGLVRYTSGGAFLGTTTASFFTNGHQCAECGRAAVQRRYRGGGDGFERH